MKHLANLPLKILGGSSLLGLEYKPLPPFAVEAIDFLSSWSKQLLAQSNIRTYPDVASFAYWCRRANLARLQRELGQQERRLGRGLALHIAPANVPVNFAYSFAFGLLAGNVNIVRVPESLPAQAGLLCNVANNLLLKAEHDRIASITSLVSYPRDDAITQALSALADLRLLWGGDQTIHHLRRMTTSPRCLDIAFADRYSICVLGAPAVLAADDEAMKTLVDGFYNDVFLLDQNACSSPHLVIWQGTVKEVKAAQDRFWGDLQVLLNSKGPQPDIHAIDKYTHLCRIAIQLHGVSAHSSTDSRLYRVDLPELPVNMADFRGRYGFFFETIDNDFTKLQRIVDTRYQTLTCFGVDSSNLVDTVISMGLTGIDRVVPVGKALDIGVIWDGYDLIRTMSRIVATQ